MSFKEDLKKPINSISLILGLAGFLFAVYEHFDTQKRREVSYRPDVQVSKIYDSKVSTSKIKLFERDTLPILQNVYVTTGAIWNSGSQPISNEDIRSAIKILLPNGYRILDYKILTEVDGQVSMFKLTQTGARSLTLSWKHFDEGQGFRFQLIFSGEEGIFPTVIGKAQGMSGIDTYDNETWSGIVPIISGTIGSLMLFVVGAVMSKIDFFKQRPIVTAFLTITLMIGTMWCVFLLIMNIGKPPL